MAELTLRLVVSLAIVLGLLILCARVAGRRFQGRRDAVVQVVHRQQIGRHASVSVVNVSGRILVLGTTDQEVRLLTELDPEDLENDGADDGAHDTHDGHDGDTLLTLVTGDDIAAVDTLLRMEDPAPVHRAPADEPTARPGRHVAGRRPAPRRAAARGGARQAATPVDGALAGSVLSTRTWRQAWSAVTGQAS